MFLIQVIGIKKILSYKYLLLILAIKYLKNTGTMRSNSSSPIDEHLHNTYFIVALQHYYKGLGTISLVIGVVYRLLQ